MGRSLYRLAALGAAQARWATVALGGGAARSAHQRRVVVPEGGAAGLAKSAVAQWTRDQLLLAGAPGAEVARIVGHSEGIAPGAVVAELARRPVPVSPMDRAGAAWALRRALGQQARIDGPELAATALSQLHPGMLEGEPVLWRVRRPGTARAVRADTRVTAALVGTLESLVPAVAAAHPLGFVELLARQLLEELDLRYDALNTEGAAAALGPTDTAPATVLAPVPGAITAGAVAYRHPGGALWSLAEVLEGAAADGVRPTPPPLDAEAAADALVALTVAGALEHGWFHADLSVEHLLVDESGRLVLPGCPSAGRFDRQLRRSAIDFLAAVLGGDYAAQVAAMDAAGAVPAAVDRDSLRRDLAATAALAPMALLGSGEQGLVSGLTESMAVLVRHGLRPPLPVVAFLRATLGLRGLLARVAPQRSLASELMPLVLRLPALRAALDEDPGAAH